MKDRFREEIAKLVLPYIQSCGCFSDCEVRASVLSYQILSLKLDDRYSLEVVDNEAELPDCPIFPEMDIAGTAIPSYKLAQRLMKEANFRKVVTDA